MIDINYGLDSAFAKSSSLSEQVSQAQNYLSKFNYEMASSAVEKSLYLCEQNLITLREVYRTININFPEKVKEYFNNSLQLLQMSVKKLNTDFDAYAMCLPYLLPNQRSNWTLYKETVGASFSYMIRKFCSENDVKPFVESSVIIVTYYNKDEKIYVCDNDNKEAKDIVNILSQYFIADDDGLLCDIAYRSKTTYANTHTEIYVSGRKDFIRLYQTIENLQTCF